MATDEATVTLSIQWIVGTAVVVFGMILGSGLLVAVYNRVTARRDSRHSTDVDNAGKQIESSDRAAQRTADRLTLIEEKLEKVQTQLTSQMVENARITAAYEHSEKENERLNSEIGRLRDRIHKHGDEIMARDLKIKMLEKRIDELASLVESYEQKRRGTRKDPMNVKLVEGDEQ